MRAERTLVLLLLASPLWAAEDESLRDVVRRQGEEIQRLTAEVGQLRGQRASDLDEAVQAYLETSGEAQPTAPEPALFGGRVRLGGYFSIEFRDDGDGSTMEFDQHRLVLKLQAEVAEAISFETEIEIEGGGADVGFLDDNEILVEYAELRIEIVEDRLLFKAGAVLVPWGRFNRFHDDPLNDLTDRPLVSRRIAAVPFDSAGIGAEGTFEVTPGWFLDYDVALVQGFTDGISTSGGTRDGRQSFRSDNNENKELFLRLVLGVPVEFAQTLELGVSGTYGKIDDAGLLDIYGFAFDLFVKRGPLEIVAEYMNLRLERDALAPLSDPRRQDGWYVEVAYHLFPSAWRGRHALLTDESTFTFVVRVEGIDLNHSTSGSTLRDDLTQVSIGFNFRPVERSVFKISYTFVDSDEAGFDSGSADRIVMSWASYF